MTGFSLQFLGTGDSAQVPVFNCECQACFRARQNPSFRRGPSSALLQLGEQQWLVDSGRMDICELFANRTLHGILQTHYHADHAQGLLHLRWGVNTKIPVWGPADPVGFADLYKHPGILDFSATWQAFEQRQIEGIRITALPLQHSRPTFGYVFEVHDRVIAYLTDTVGLPKETSSWLKNKSIDYCIVDCSEPPRAQTPRNHNDLNSALAMCAGLSIETILLTHIGHEMDSWLMDYAHTLPASVKAARDDMRIEITETGMLHLS